MRLLSLVYFLSIGPVLCSTAPQPSPLRVELDDTTGTLYGYNLADATAVTIDSSARAFVASKLDTVDALEISLQPGDAAKVGHTATITVTTLSGSASTTLTVYQNTGTILTLSTFTQVPVKSNGKNVGLVTGPYQCVELIKRYYALLDPARFGGGGPYSTTLWSGSNGLAKDYYNDDPSPKGLIRIPNDGKTLLRPGDVVVFDSIPRHPSGHVAIIDSEVTSTSTQLEIVEQNWTASPFGRATLFFDANRKLTNRGPWPILGFLRSAAPVDLKAIGAFDDIDLSIGKIYGWAKDVDNPTAPVTVHIYIDNMPGPGISPAAAVSASEFRIDVGFHAFNYIIPNSYRDGQNHTVSVWAIDLSDPGGSHNVQLPSNGRTNFTLSVPNQPGTELSQTTLGSDPTLLSYYRFEGNTADSRGGNTGTAFNAPPYVPGRFGQGIKLSSLASQYVAIPSTAMPSNTADFSFALWINFAGLKTFNGLMVNYDGSGPFSYGGFRYQSGALVFDKRDASGVSHDALYVWAPMPGTWHHLAYTSSATNGAHVYIDGAVVVFNPTYTDAIGTSMNPMLIGAYGGNGLPTPGWYADAIFDDVAVFGKELTQAEITTLSGGTTPPYSPPPPPSGDPSVVFLQSDFSVSGNCPAMFSRCWNVNLPALYSRGVPPDGVTGELGSLTIRLALDGTLHPDSMGSFSATFFGSNGSSCVSDNKPDPHNFVPNTLKDFTFTFNNCTTGSPASFDFGNGYKVGLMGFAVNQNDVNTGWLMAFNNAITVPYFVLRKQ